MLRLLVKVVADVTSVAVGWVLAAEVVVGRVVVGWVVVAAEVVVGRVVVGWVVVAVEVVVGGVVVFGL